MPKKQQHQQQQQQQQQQPPKSAAQAAATAAMAAASNLPRAPKCAPQQENVPTLRHHGDVIARPYDWLKHAHTDPAVARYLRSESQYAHTVLKQVLGPLRHTLETEIGDRESGGDAQIPQDSHGFYYYSVTPDDDDDDDDHDDDDGDDERGHDVYYRVAKRPGLDLISDFSTLFTNDPLADLRHPRGAQRYVDLNALAKRFKATYTEVGEVSVSPDGRSVATCVDFTSAAEECAVVVQDIASQRILCVAGQVTKHLTEQEEQLPSSSKKKKKKKSNKTIAPPAAAWRKSVGVVVDSVSMCADFCAWLDNDTVGFVEMTSDTHRGYRIWVQSIGPDAMPKIEQHKNKKNKKQQQKQIIINNQVGGEAATRSADGSDVDGAGAAAAPPAVAPASAESSSQLTLLYEEPDPTFEIVGLYRTNDDKYTIVNTCHSACSIPLTIDVSSPSSPGNFVARPFLPRQPNTTVWLEHDPRPIEFFTGGGGGGGKDLPRGTWFITHNLHGDGCELRVDICSDSDDVDRGDRRNWRPFFAPTRDDAEPLENIFIDDVTCYQNFIVFTVRRRGFQNVMLLDLFDSRRAFSCPVKASELVDVHALLEKQIAETDAIAIQQHRATWLEFDDGCDFDTRTLPITAHNVVVPDRDFVLSKQQTKQGGGGGGWTMKLLLTDAQNNFGSNKYTVEIRHVPVAAAPISSAAAAVASSSQSTAAASSSPSTAAASKSSSAVASDDDDETKACQACQVCRWHSRSPLLTPTTPIVRVPLLVVYRTDKFAPGSAPCLLESYGSYGDSHDVEYDAARISLLNRGVVYACAMVRGGGEFGEAWRRAGAKEQRPNTFHDFLACADYCRAQKICDGARICAYGESAGGSVVAAAMNMRPDLFAGVVARVPFVDCLATMLDATQPLTAQEHHDWGDPAASKALYDVIKSYSPTDNLPSPADVKRDGIVFPHLYVESGLGDARVKYHEAAIWVAMLRERWGPSAEAGRILVHKVNLVGGHDGASDVDEDRQTAQELAFICHSLGIHK